MEFESIKSREKITEDNPNSEENSNFFMSKLIIHFEELNIKILELYKMETISRFYEIKRLSEEHKQKLGNILSEIPKSFEKVIRVKLETIYEKFKLKEKLKVKTEARIFSRYKEELKINIKNLGKGDETIRDENSIIRTGLKDYLTGLNEKTKKELEILRKERENLKNDNKYSFN
jgi:hypothetical protein